MASSKQQLEAAFAPLFKEAGYRKHALTWHRKNAETISVFNVQKSQWGDQFYLNCGIYLCDLGDESQPPSYRCHLNIRVDRLVPDRDRLLLLLDFDQPVKSEFRIEELAELVNKWAMPWLEKCSTISALRELPATGLPSQL